MIGSTRMNVNSFQDREHVTSCQEIAEQRPSNCQASTKLSKPRPKSLDYKQINWFNLFHPQHGEIMDDGVSLAIIS